MNHSCTWFCADEKDDDSSGDLYWTLIRRAMGVPALPIRTRAGYSIQPYFRAIANRLRRAGRRLESTGNEFSMLYENSRSAGLL